MKRVLFVVNNPAFFVSHRLELGRAVVASGNEAIVASPDGAGVHRLRAEGIGHVELPFDRAGTNPLRELGVLRRVVRLYRDVRPDLVHHVTIKPVVYGGIAARLAGVPAVVHAVSGLGYAFTGRTLRAWIVRRAALGLYRHAFGHPCSRVIFQNPDDRNFFLDRGLVSLESTALIRGAGVDVVRFRPEREPTGQPLVVFPARMLVHKGVHELVEAARLVRRRAPQTRFALVGDADERNPSTIPVRQLREWEEEGAIEWWGHRDDMPDVYAAAQIVCLPSWREGLPKALLEAAACGRPIVATDVPGCREAVHQGHTGLLVPERSPAALAKALLRLLCNRVLRARFGAAGRRRAVAEFRVERVVRATVQLYDDLFRRSGREVARPMTESGRRRAQEIA